MLVTRLFTARFTNLIRNQSAEIFEIGFEGNAKTASVNHLLRPITLLTGKENTFY